MAQEAAVSEIRRFQPNDRAVVRRICCDTADAGGPVESLIGTSTALPAFREFFADMLVSPYTDRNQPAWVAVESTVDPVENGVGCGRAPFSTKSTVVGYVMGTFTPVSFFWRQLPAAVARGLVRGAFWQVPVLRFALANLRLPEHGDAALDVRHWPAHLHVNLLPQERGGGLGRALVETFLDAARQQAVRGVVASVRADNTRGRRFFERLGFEPLARRPIYRTIDGTQRFAVIHGYRL